MQHFVEREKDVNKRNKEEKQHKNHTIQCKIVFVFLGL